MTKVNFEVNKISGIGKYQRTELKDRKGNVVSGDVYFVVHEDGSAGKAFLVVRPNTIEIRIDANLSKIMREDYESVMQSRYFGKGGVEIVTSGQMSEDELYDFARVSYNATKEMAE